MNIYNLLLLAGKTILNNIPRGAIAVHDGTKFIFGSNTNNLTSTTDFVNFQNISLSANIPIANMVFANGKVIGTSGLYPSTVFVLDSNNPNGLLSATPYTTGTVRFPGVTYNGSQYVIAGGAYSADPYGALIMKSSDFVTWTAAFNTLASSSGVIGLHMLKNLNGYDISTSASNDTSTRRRILYSLNNAAWVNWGAFYNTVDATYFKNRYYFSCHYNAGSTGQYGIYSYAAIGSGSTTRNLVADARYMAVSGNGSTLIVQGTSQYYRSTDGTTFTPVSNRIINLTAQRYSDYPVNRLFFVGETLWEINAPVLTTSPIIYVRKSSDYGTTWETVYTSSSARSD